MCSAIVRVPARFAERADDRPVDRNGVRACGDEGAAGSLVQPLDAAGDAHRSVDRRIRLDAAMVAARLRFRKTERTQKFEIVIGDVEVDALPHAARRTCPGMHHACAECRAIGDPPRDSIDS
jgi:hypothetical protein